MSVGTLAPFLTFMTILQMPVRQLGLMVNSFARASTCGTRLFDLLDLERRDQGRARARSRSWSPRACCASRMSTSAIRARRTGRCCRGVSFEAQPRRDHRHRRPARQRQVDHRPPDPALLRRDRRPDHHRRPGHPRGHAAIAAPGGRASCSRTRSCSPPRSRTTSPMATPGRRSRASSAPPSTRSCTTTSSACRPATTPSSASAASRSPAASASG